MAESGKLLNWIFNKDSYIAYIILMDQFSRHIYRGTPKAYKNDNKVLIFSKLGFDMYKNDLNAVELMFVLLPFQHTEKLHEQKLGVEILKNLVNSNKDISKAERETLKTALYYQTEHCKVIRRFGSSPRETNLLEESLHMKNWNTLEINHNMTIKNQKLNSQV